MKPTTISSRFRLRQAFAGQVIPAMAGIAVVIFHE
jgi:hypothetical protein